jgi:hypothetical protein
MPDLEKGKIYEISFKYGVACISSTFERVPRDERVPREESYEVTRNTDTVILLDFIERRMLFILKCISMSTNELLFYEFYVNADEIELLV